MLFRLLPVPLCYEASACKRSAESQTLKVHPVASKTLTQKIPLYAAPERLVGHFSFSIVYFLGIVTYFGYSDVTSAELLRLDQSADFLTHTHSAGRCEARCCEET